MAGRVGALAFALSLLIAAPAWADLRVETEITYTADVAAGSLGLESHIRLTNLTPDETDGVQIIRYFYDHIQIRVPDTVEDFTATSGGSGLDFSLEPTGRPEDEGFLRATIGLGRRLFFEESMDLVVSYRIPGDPPRSDTTFRINPAYISFGVAGWGDPGRVTVNVVAPATFDLRLEESDWDSSRVEGGNRVFTVTDIADPAGFLIQVRGYDDGALATVTATAVGLEVVVRSWPNDDEWSALVVDTVVQGLPQLSRLIGLDMPEGPLEIRESADVTLAGYGGWYLQAEELIEIGEWASPQLVLHELSHMWFNHRLFRERWIHEGLAEEYSTRAAHQAGLLDEGTVRPRAAPAPSPLVGPLNDWVIPTELGEQLERDEVAEYEQHGYRASFWVLQELVREIGTASMTDVLRAAAEHRIAYRGAPEPERVEPPNDWRRFLDLLEELGGSSRAEDLFATHVTDEDLSERARARESYQALLARSGWQAPYYVRDAMARWDFAEALARIDQAEAIVDRYLVTEENYTTLGLAGPGVLQDEYEWSTTSLDGALGLADRLVETSAEVVEAQHALGRERGVLMAVGLIGSDPEGGFRAALEALDSGELATASALAVDLVALVANAERNGVQRLVIGGAILLLLLLAAYLAVRRRRPAPDD